MLGQSHMHKVINCIHRWWHSPTLKVKVPLGGVWKHKNREERDMRRRKFHHSRALQGLPGCSSPISMSQSFPGLQPFGDSCSCWGSPQLQILQEFGLWSSKWWEGPKFPGSVEFGSVTDITASPPSSSSSLVLNYKNLKDRGFRTKPSRRYICSSREPPELPELRVKSPNSIVGNQRKITFSCQSLEMKLSISDSSSRNLQNNTHPIPGTWSLHIPSVRGCTMFFLIRALV